MSEWRFIRPLDTLHLRGNRLFGDAGDHGDALMPPWPSVVAGALRSRMLADAGVHDLTELHLGVVQLGSLQPVLGALEAPGTFRIAWFGLARRESGSGRVEPIFPLPADLAVEDAGGNSEAPETVHRLEPTPLPPGLEASHPTEHIPVLRSRAPFKPRADRWLSEEGMAASLRGEAIEAEHLVASAELWGLEPRLGIALDARSRTAAEGNLYTAETIAMVRTPAVEAGFAVRVEGADGLVPSSGVVRLGGDGRGAAIEGCALSLPEPEWEAIAAEGRLRLLLASPGILEHGWRLPGTSEDGAWQGPDGVRARVVAAAVPRHQVVSGWDLARRRNGAGGGGEPLARAPLGMPKPALRAAPAGSVYWLDEYDGDAGALRKLATEGLWAISGYPGRQRRAEGYNNVMIAAWPPR